MHSATRRGGQRGNLRIPAWFGLCVFLAVAIFFLWEEHQAHIFGVLPYALVLLCVFNHFFMHRHGRDAGSRAPHGGVHPHERGDVS